MVVSLRVILMSSTDNIVCFAQNLMTGFEFVAICVMRCAVGSQHRMEDISWKHKLSCVYHGNTRAAVNL